MNSVLHDIREALQNEADEQLQLSSQRFFKEGVRTYGVKSAVVGKIAKAALKKPQSASKVEIFSLCEELWKSG